MDEDLCYGWEKRASKQNKRRRKLDSYLMEKVGSKWCGNGNPPMSNHKIYIKDDGVIRVFSMIDDGGFVGIGYPDEWHVIMRRKAVRMLAWWYFKLWVWNWFGLREFIYYRALHHKVRGEWKWKPYPKFDDSVRLSSYEEWEKDHIDMRHIPDDPRPRF